MGNSFIMEDKCITVLMYYDSMDINKRGTLWGKMEEELRYTVPKSEATYPLQRKTQQPEENTM